MIDYWQGRAECAKYDPQLWDTDEPDPGTLAVCGRCPVKGECLQDALVRCESHGVRGGLTPRQREAIRLGRRVPAAGPRTCRACKRTFEPKHHRARYCGKECKRAGVLANQRRYDARYREKLREQVAS